jgi:HSP90 family molecular chaperone
MFIKEYFFYSLHLKEEAHDFIEENTLKDLIKKYSQFINFNIYIWSSKVSVQCPYSPYQASLTTAQARCTQYIM